MKIVFLTSGSTHHWYFVNYLKSKNINFDFILSETENFTKFEVLSELEKKRNFEKKDGKKWLKLLSKKLNILKILITINQ